MFLHVSASSCASTVSIYNKSITSNKGQIKLLFDFSFTIDLYDVRHSSQDGELNGLGQCKTTLVFFVCRGKSKLVIIDSLKVNYPAVCPFSMPSTLQFVP